MEATDRSRAQHLLAPYKQEVARFEPGTAHLRPSGSPWREIHTLCVGGDASRNCYGLGVVFDPHRARNGITLTSHVFALRSIASESTASAHGAWKATNRCASRFAIVPCRVVQPGARPSTQGALRLTVRLVCSSESRA